MRIGGLKLSEMEKTGAILAGKWRESMVFAVFLCGIANKLCAPPEFGR